MFYGGMAELGRRRGLKILYRKMYGFYSRSRHHYGASTVWVRSQLITGASLSREVRVLDAPPFSNQSNTGVSPSGKATAFDAVIRQFESDHPCHFTTGVA